MYLHVYKKFSLEGIRAYGQTIYINICGDYIYIYILLFIYIYILMECRRLDVFLLGEKVLHLASDPSSFLMLLVLIKGFQLLNRLQSLTT